MGCKLIVIGRNVATELLINNEKINKIYLLNNFNDENITNLIKKRDINVIYKSKEELFRIDNGNNQGIILDIPDFKYCSINDIIKDQGLIVILDHIEDPHNFGAIIRTCEAAGVDGIIIPKDRSVSVNSTVMKTSSGALNNMKISIVTNINSTIKQLKDKGFWIVGTSMDSKEGYHNFNYTFPIALIIGSEGKGISRLTKEACDVLVTIPMKGKINSLNASVATGIILYELIKHRK